MARSPRRGAFRYGSLGLLGALIAIAVPPPAFGGETCDVSANPPGPVQPGAYADVLANCTGSPAVIQWSSSLSSCVPSVGPDVTCFFWTAGTAVVTARATYSSGVGGSFSILDSYAMTVTSAAPPSCRISAYPPGPVRPGAYVDVTAACTGNPLSLQWGFTLADCNPMTGYSTVCHFPTVGSAQLSVEATYASSLGGPVSAFDTYPVEVSTSAPATCHVSADPSGPIQVGGSAAFTATCTEQPAFIQWYSSLADCTPLTGATTTCTFPVAGSQRVTAAATFAGSFGNGDSYFMQVNPSTFTVTNNGDSGPGSLRYVVGQAVAAGKASTVNFAANVTGTITLTTGSIQIAGPVSIVGPGADVLAVDGNLNNRIFSIFATDPACPALDGTDYLVAISGLTLVNARRNTDNTGGAIWTSHSLALDRMIVRNNTARSGAGVAMYLQYPGQSFAITQSQFLDNTAREVVPSTASTDSGGAVYIAERCGGTQTTPVNVSIANSLFQGNRVRPFALIGHGGAIATNAYADITITDTRLVDNAVVPPDPPLNVSYNGGAIWATARTLTLERVEIAGNAAKTGGGLRFFNDAASRQTPDQVMTVKFVNSTISGNVSTSTGGAFDVYGNVALELASSTVTDNNSTGLANDGLSFLTGATVPATGSNAIAPTLKLVSSVLANNGEGSDVASLPPLAIDATSSLIRTICPTCNITVSGSGNLLSVDPLLGPLAYNGGPMRTHALQAGSPAINAGSNPLGLTTDQRGTGFPRVVGAAADIGAYEFSVAAAPVVQGWVARKVHGSAGTFDLPLAVTPANPTTEPRSGGAGGNHTIVFVFDKEVTAGNAAVTAGTATVGTPTFSGNEMRVPLTGVTNQQYVTVVVSDVVAADGGTGGSGSVRVGFLLGDVSQNRVVTVSDLAQVNAQIAQVVTAANYLRDVNVSGTLTVADKGIANTQITKALPTP